jgi:large subunit ribosomal protein L22
MATNTRNKAKLREETRDNRPRCVAKYIRISPFKVRSVLDIIRGKGLNEAVAILNSTNKSSSAPILKVVNSAAANAEVKNYNKDELFVAECFADPGPILKRMMPRAKGRGTRILKRTSHITVILDKAAN